ncbi:MAG: [Fe-Fe] hydrogenase large subunit C-terminal domain-containing protein [Caldisericia bacterium]|jgi:iron only hydrogenase large subunit-like protein|nr:[Fe-Fe] hydrogenase large subunit C-terminal domain-containing protein [Caldisericia bacterium]
MKDELYFHSIRINYNICIGCTHCLRACPTEAIRVRNRKSEIYNLKCIDCGECFRVCPTEAIFVNHDLLEILKNYKYKILVISDNLSSINFGRMSYTDIIKKLFSFGFDEIWEESIANEMYLISTEKFLNENKNLKRPVISTACPSSVRLIQVSYPSLIENLSKINLPIDILGNYIKKYHKEKENLGLFYLATYPCKITAIKNPLGLKNSPYDGVFLLNSIYKKLIIEKNLKEGILYRGGKFGTRMARIGGEEEFLKNFKVLFIDGIWNLKKFFEALEEERVPNFDYIESRVCQYGCVNGILLPNQNINLNIYSLKQKEKELEGKTISDFFKDKNIDEVLSQDIVYLNEEIKPRPTYILSENMDTAAKILQEIDLIYEILPKLDCGSCGAPSCKAFAEDVVLNRANINDCKFIER